MNLVNNLVKVFKLEGILNLQVTQKIKTLGSLINLSEVEKGKVILYVRLILCSNTNYYNV